MVHILATTRWQREETDRGLYPGPCLEHDPRRATSKYESAAESIQGAMKIEVASFPGNRSENRSDSLAEWPFLLTSSFTGH
jgi:hypothetical protein